MTLSGRFHDGITTFEKIDTVDNWGTAMKSNPMTQKRLQNLAEKLYNSQHDVHRAAHAVSASIRALRDRNISEFAAGWTQVLERMQYHYETLQVLDKNYEKFTDLVYPTKQ